MNFLRTLVQYRYVGDAFKKLVRVLYHQFMDFLVHFFDGNVESTKCHPQLTVDRGFSGRFTRRMIRALRPQKIFHIVLCIKALFIQSRNVLHQHNLLTKCTILCEYMGMHVFVQRHIARRYVCRRHDVAGAQMWSA